MTTTQAAAKTEEFRRRFDESKVKRNKGRFAKKVGRALVGLPPSKRDKEKPEAAVFKPHANGDVTHVSEDGTQRMVYDSSTGKFSQEVKQPDGSWQSIGQRNKLQAYLLTKFGWKVAEPDDQLSDQERTDRNTIGDVNAPAPVSPLNPGPGANPPGNAPTPPAAPNAPNAPAAASPGPHDSAAFTSVDPNYPTRDEADMNAMQAEMESNNPPPLTADEEQAVYDYSLTGYHDMNDCLRTGNNCTAEANTRNANLQSALRPLGEPVTVFRSTNLEHLGGAQSLDDLANLVGSDIADSGFSSTSLDPSVTELFGDVDMQIEVPAGTPSIFPGSRANMPTEQELILGPGTRFRVLEVNRTTPSGRPSVRLQVIP